MNHITIPHVELTNEQKQEQAKLMAACGQVLRKYQEKIKNKLDVGKYPRTELRRELFVKLKNNDWKSNKPIYIHGVRFLKKDVETVLAVREIEFEVMSGYSKLMCRCAHKWAKKINHVEITFDSLYQEAIIAMQNAIYGYVGTSDGKTIAFITYVTWAVHRQMDTFANKQKPLSKWTNRARKLYASYEQARQDANAHVTFDDLCDRLKLSKKERISLQSMLVGVIRQTDFEDDQFEQSISSQDKQFRLSSEHLEAIQKADLTDWEKTVLNAYLKAPLGSMGWKTEVAAATINPATGKAYSRAAPEIAMKRIKEKLIEVYSNAA